MKKLNPSSTLDQSIPACSIAICGDDASDIPRHVSDLPCGLSTLLEVKYKLSRLNILLEVKYKLMI